MILLKASLTWQLAVRHNKTLKPMVESGCGNLDYEKVRSSRYTLAQLSVLLLAGSVMYNMDYRFRNNVRLLALVLMITHTNDVDTHPLELKLVLPTPPRNMYNWNFLTGPPTPKMKHVSFFNYYFPLNFWKIPLVRGGPRCF